jgi:predicted homoserine dehydrogenase-like protein
MYLNSKLEDHHKEIRIAFIGCGKFVSMFLAQYSQLKKIKIDSIIDINIKQAKENCRKSGLNEKIINEINFSSSLDNSLDREIEIFIEATGNPIMGTVHAVKIIKNK